MQEIASFTFAYEAFPEAVGMLWKRLLQDNKQNWRRVYKSLLLLDYLLKNGSERVVTSAREHIYDLRGTFLTIHRASAYFTILLFFRSGELHICR